MLSLPRRDIFACRKSDIVCFAHSDIIFAVYTREANITCLKANINEKSNCKTQLLFSWRAEEDSNSRPSGP